ncbi:DUF881 domain-containing protein [Oerskovia sp. NPDC057915]|uniref:DUF881 domain-containing protein n=1 Tax=Oerskovia sp. NPDC057915 TaxID=3346280 RepID=UPI0036DED206
MTTSPPPEGNGPADPETSEAPEEAAVPVTDVPAGGTEHLDEDAAAQTAPAASTASTVDTEETGPGDPSGPDVEEAAAEAPVAPGPAAVPEAPAAPSVLPVVPAAHDAPDRAAPGTGRGEAARDDAPPIDGPIADTVASVASVASAEATPPAPDITDVAPGAGSETPATSRAAAAPPVGPDRPHGRHEASGDAPATPAATPTGSSGGWAKLGRAMRPTVTRSQLLAGLLCALLGFALAVQVSQTQEQQLSSLRQSDLVRLLDDVTQRANDLERRVEGLQDTRDELSSGSGQQRAALELAQRQSQTQGILSGRLPAEGPGITLTITESDQRIPASKLFNILEELRNAGVEVVEVNGVRLVTSSYFEETNRGMVVDGQKISSPYTWQAIGDPSTLETALEIPGGAMSSVRNEGADPKITQEDLITISSTREPETPEFATPVPAEGGS